MFGFTPDPLGIDNVRSVHGYRRRRDFRPD